MVYLMVGLLTFSGSSEFLNIEYKSQIECQSAQKVMTVFLDTNNINHSKLKCIAVKTSY